MHYSQDVCVREREAEGLHSNFSVSDDESSDRFVSVEMASRLLLFLVCSLYH